MNPRAFKRINYALAGTLVAAGASLDEIAPKVGAKNANSLRVGLQKRGVSARECQMAAKRRIFADAAPGNAVQKLVSEAGSILREMIGESATTAARNLASVRPGRSLATLREYVDVLEPISRVGDRLYGWSQSQGTPTFNVLVLESNATGGIHKGDQVEVSSLIAQPGPACGVDTTTSGVPSDNPNIQTPQSEEVVDIVEVEKQT